MVGGKRLLKAYCNAQERRDEMHVLSRCIAILYIHVIPYELRNEIICKVGLDFVSLDCPGLHLEKHEKTRDEWRRTPNPKKPTAHPATLIKQSQCTTAGEEDFAEIPSPHHVAEKHRLEVKAIRRSKLPQSVAHNRFRAHSGMLIGHELIRIVFSDKSKLNPFIQIMRHF